VPRPFLLAAFLLLAPLSLSAQEAMPASGSGTVTPSDASGATMLLERIDVLATEAAARDIASRADVELREDKLKGLLDDRARQSIRAAEHRVECRERLRRANKETQFDVTATCMREELLLELAVLRSERTDIAKWTFLGDEPRIIVLARTDALIDAAQTIVDAIDAEVYAEAGELSDAKLRLHMRYRVPRMAAMLLLPADAERAWAALFSLRIAQRVEAEPELAQETDLLLPAVACLEAAHAGWAAFPPISDYIEMKDVFGQYQSERSQCADSVRRVNAWPAPPGTDDGVKAE
jgi:hypothetical protein